MGKGIKGGGGSIRKKAIMAVVLAVVAIGMGVGTYLWQKGRLTTGADVEEQALDEEQSAAGNDEWKVGDDKVALSSGTLVKQSDDSKVYLVYRGNKQLFKDATAFIEKGFKWENIVVVSASYLDFYDNGSDIQSGAGALLPNGMIAKFASEPNVYSVVNGKLKLYPSPSVYLSRHNWNEIATVPDSWRPGMAVDSNPMTYRGGNLVKDESGPNVYWVAGNIKYPIPSVEVFTSFGFDWQNLIIAEPGILNAYTTGKDIDKLENIPLLVWKEANADRVHLIKFYNNEATDLLFGGPTVFTNRFSWAEINTVKKLGEGTPAPLPSGQVKCTVDGKERYTYWQEIDAGEYIASTYPNGITKAYKIKRADSAQDPSVVRIIFNIKNNTQSSSTTFSAGDKIQVTADMVFSDGRNGANVVGYPGELRTALVNSATNHTAREWIFDDFPKMEVGKHYPLTKAEYTLPNNIDLNSLVFWSRYNYYAEDDDNCYWPAQSDDPYIVFPKLNP